MKMMALIMSEIGQNKIRVDAFEKVTGKALFPGDINYPNQLFMKTLFAKHSPAIINSIDKSKAESLPGVVSIITAKDVPNNEHGLHEKDTPVLCGPGSNKKFAERILHYGDQVALVIAESEQIANSALDMVKIDWQDLEPIYDPFKSLNTTEPLIHPEKESNIFAHYKIRRGDVNIGFNEAFTVVEDEYITGMQEHAFLQPEAGLGYIDEKDRITIVTGGQWAHRDQKQIAHALDLPVDNVRVVYSAIGGAFGGREENSIQISLALAVWKLRNLGIVRPIKLIWDRSESFIGHPKRHLFIIRAKWGATKNGELTAAEMLILQDGGAYLSTSSSVLGNATLMSLGAYKIPNVKIDAYGVYTNNPPGGAMRGFGAPQGTFACENQMNKLAEILSIDPIELRRINMVQDGDIFSTGAQITKIPMVKVLENCGEVYGWNDNLINKEQLTNKSSSYFEQDNSLLGVGIACGMKNTGLSFGAHEECSAKLELHGKDSIEEVILYHAAAEVGQGVHTIMAQMVADSLSVSLDKVKLVLSDTSSSEDSGPVSASRMTFMAGNAIIGAAENALISWKNEERPAIGKFTYYPPKTYPIDSHLGIAIYPYFSYGYASVIVELKLDPLTGIVRILRVVVSDDLGKIINPKLARGQIEGAVVQALGYCLMEDLKIEEGRIRADNFSKYLIPGILDIPDEITSSLLEYGDSISPLGAHGVGEMAFVPFAAAVSAALFNATGVWFNETPFTPERILIGLKNNKNGKR